MRISNLILAVFLVVSFLGFLDASYLAFEHYNGRAISCSLVSGCEKVTTSAYATIAGVPVALLGAIYYLAVFLFAVAYLNTKNARVGSVLTALPIVGLLASAWFVYLQLFVLRAICLYCVGSALSSTILFVFAVIVMLSHQRGARRLSAVDE